MLQLALHRHTHNRHDICTNPCVLNNMPCDAHPSTTHIKSAHALKTHCQNAMTDSDKQQITDKCTNNVQWQHVLPPKSPCTHIHTKGTLTNNQKQWPMTQLGAAGNHDGAPATEVPTPLATAPHGQPARPVCGNWLITCGLHAWPCVHCCMTLLPHLQA